MHKPARFTGKIRKIEQELTTLSDILRSESESTMITVGFRGVQRVQRPTIYSLRGTEFR